MHDIIIISLVICRIRAEFLESLELLLSMGYNIAATPGTAEYYTNHGLKITSLLKPGDVAAVAAVAKNGKAVNGNHQHHPIIDGEDRSAIKWIESRVVDLVINIPEGTTRRDEVTAGYLIRRAAVDFGVGLLTNIKYVLSA